jgi:autotransporter-associated beta strand protein
VSIATGAVLYINGISQSIGSLIGPVGSAVKLGSGGQLTVSSAASTSFAGNISGTGAASVTKSGAGTLTVSGLNTYTGPTTISGGTLKLASPSAITAATPVASYSFSHLTGNTVINDGSGGSAMNGTLKLNGGTGSINPTGGPSAGFGALVLNGNGTTVDISSGVTDLSSNSTWTVSAWIKTTQAGATILNKGDGSNWNSGFTTFYLGNGNNAGSGAQPDAVRWGGGWLAGSTPVNDGNWHLLTYTDSAGTKAVYVDGVAENISQNQFSNTDTGSRIRIGFAPTNVDGEVPTSGSLSGISMYNAALSPAQVAALYGAVAGTNGAGPLPSNTDLTITAGATLDLNSLTQTIASLSGPAGSTVLLGTGQLIVNSAASTQFAGTISGNGGTLVKKGAGTLTIAGVKSYSGSTIVTAGTLKFDVTSATNLGAGAMVSIASGATLELAGSVSAMGASGGNRANIVNSSSAPGIVVSGSHQVVGGIDGSGTTQVNGGSDLTADHIIQSALMIGGTAGSPGVVTIDASDASGNPLTVASVALPSDSNPIGLAGSPFDESLLSGNSVLSNGSYAQSRAASLATGNAAVPEPAAFVLAFVALTATIFNFRQTVFRRRMAEWLKGSI